MTLSTHVLDTARGGPAEGVAFRLLQDGRELFAGFTNEDGRCPGLRDLALPAGRYRLEFRVIDYLRKSGAVRGEAGIRDRCRQARRGGAL